MVARRIERGQPRLARPPHFELALDPFAGFEVEAETVARHRAGNGAAVRAAGQGEERRQRLGQSREQRLRLGPLGGQAQRVEHGAQGVGCYLPLLAVDVAPRRGDARGLRQVAKISIRHPTTFPVGAAPASGGSTSAMQACAGSVPDASDVAAPSALSNSNSPADPAAARTCEAERLQAMVRRDPFPRRQRASTAPAPITSAPNDAAPTRCGTMRSRLSVSNSPVTDRG